MIVNTISRHRIDLRDPKPDGISIEDIANSLSKICRFAGQSRYFYSVAEHSLLVSCAVKREHAKWALLHDAAEAYMGDVIRPVRELIASKELVELERRLLQAIAIRFDLPARIPGEVKRWDDEFLKYELIYLGLDPCRKVPPPDFPVKISCYSPDEAKRLFLRRFSDLWPGSYTLKDRRKLRSSS